MDTDSIDRLYVQEGEMPNSAHLQRLEAAIHRQNRLPSVGTCVRTYPFGTITNYRGNGGGGFVSDIFEPSVSNRGDHFEISWRKGLINGVEPTIDGHPISKPLDDTGVPPVFQVPAESFGEAGECLIFFRLYLDEGWFPASIEPVALPDNPPLAPWQADKLALILYPDGTIWRALKMNVGYLAMNRKSNGTSQPIFWAKP